MKFLLFSGILLLFFEAANTQDKACTFYGGPFFQPNNWDDCGRPTTPAGSPWEINGVLVDEIIFDTSEAGINVFDKFKIPSTVTKITIISEPSGNNDDWLDLFVMINNASQVSTLNLDTDVTITGELSLPNVKELNIGADATLTLDDGNLILPADAVVTVDVGATIQEGDSPGALFIGGSDDNNRVWGYCDKPDYGDCLVSPVAPTDADGSRTISNELTVLPIELMYFKANVENREVHLNWQSVWELNNEYYTLERSPDGEYYEEVVRLDGAGNSSEALDYHYTDTQPLERLSWYRLSQTDFDGTTEMFDPIKVNLDPLYKAKAVISPNPVSMGEFKLALEGFLSEQKVRVTMTDLLGITLFEEEITTNDEGYYVLEMSVPYSIPSGFYNFLCRSSSGTLTSRALLQR